MSSSVLQRLSGSTAKTPRAAQLLYLSSFDPPPSTAPPSFCLRRVGQAWAFAFPKGDGAAFQNLLWRSLTWPTPGVADGETEAAGLASVQAGSPGWQMRSRLSSQWEGTQAWSWASSPCALCVQGTLSIPDLKAIPREDSDGFKVTD